MSSATQWYEDYYDEVGRYKLQEEKVVKMEAENKVKRSSHTPLFQGSINRDKKVK